MNVWHLKSDYTLLNPAFENLIPFKVLFVKILVIYRIIPKIIPGLIFSQSTFLGLFLMGLFLGGAYFQDEICIIIGIIQYIIGQLIFLSICNLYEFSVFIDSI